MALYADVVISINHKDVDRAFLYKIAEDLKSKAQKGSRVIVPFGKGNKPCEGFILDLYEKNAEEIDIDDEKIKYISSFPDDYQMFHEDILALALWMKDKYYSTLSECLKCIMPPGVKIKNNNVYTVELMDASLKLTPIQNKVYSYIAEKDYPVSIRELSDEFGDRVQNILTVLEQKSCVKKNQITKISNLTQKLKFVSLNPDMDSPTEKEVQNILSQEKNKQGAVIRFLLEYGQTALSDLKKGLNISDSPIKTLSKKSIVIIDEVISRRKTIHTESEDHPVTLTREQDDAVNKISEILKNPKKDPVLLHGATGSGKTEVYLRLIEKVIKTGKQAIMLVPEIALTPQTVDRFYARFKDNVTVTHSRLSNGERYDQWINAKEGRISVMIGPRSAIFAPFENLGIIVIDEEHENTYKSEMTPKYDTKQVALKRCELSGALLILGSATPGIDSYYMAQTKKYTLITMANRVNSAMPQVDIVDMRNELEIGNRSIFSEKLFESINESLLRKQQIILFLNRRGFSTFVSCRKCGFVMKCDDCNVNYTYHIYTDQLLCHYCGKQLQNPSNCPQCGSKYIKYFGVGTQKIEDEVRLHFKNARTLRMDLDTTTHKNSHEAILNQFKSGEADILIGTQMIAKGLDFPNVTLVGVMAADISINNGDYRSGETTFQLLTQVSGRAGRAELLGKVIIQTYNPEHYAVLYAKDHNYNEFYQHEIALRRQMNYPPFSHLFVALFIGESEKKVIITLFKLLDIMKYYNKNNEFELLGPAPAFISKIKKKYRWKIIVKYGEEQRLKNYMLYCVAKLEKTEDLTGIQIHLTLDPANNI